MKKRNNSSGVVIPKILYDERLHDDNAPHIGSNLRTGWICTKINMVSTVHLPKYSDGLSVIKE